MRSIPTLAAALSLTLLLSACGGSGSPAAAPADPPATPTAAEVQAPAADPAASTQEYDAHVFPVPMAGGFIVRIDQDMADVLAALGEPQSYFEAASCAFEGLDKTYTYSGFSITTRPDGDRDYVNDILLTDDSVTTLEGLYIGSTRADVEDAYGPGEAFGAGLNYTKGGTTLTFIFSGDSVISIEYTAQ